MAQDNPKVLLVRKLPEELSENEVVDLLKYFGALSVSVMSPKGHLKNCAFAEFKTKEEAEIAMRKLHQAVIFGSRLIAVYSDKTFLPVERENMILPAENMTKAQPNIVTDTCQKCTLAKHQPDPSLHYLYPPPNTHILNNISHAMVSIPHFYIQVLHLMNKMNLPPPFTQSKQKSLFENATIPAAPTVTSSSESELETEEEDGGTPPQELVKEILEEKRAATQAFIDRKRKREGSGNVGGSGKKALVLEEDSSRESTEISEEGGRGGKEVVVTAPPLAPSPPGEQAPGGGLAGTSGVTQPCLDTPSPLRFNPPSGGLHHPSGAFHPGALNSGSYHRAPGNFNQPPGGVRQPVGGIRQPLGGMRQSSGGFPPPSGGLNLSFHRVRGPGVPSQQGLRPSLRGPIPGAVNQGPIPGAINRGPISGAVNQGPISGAVNRGPIPGAVNRGPISDVLRNPLPNPTPGTNPRPAPDAFPPPAPAVTRPPLAPPVSRIQALAPPVAPVSPAQLLQNHRSGIRSKRKEGEELTNLPVFKKYTPGEPSHKLYIKNLNHKAIKESELVDIFRPYADFAASGSETGGHAFEVKLMIKGQMKGQAFITLPNVAAAKDALGDAHGYVIHGKPMAVMFARSKS